MILRNGIIRVVVCLAAWSIINGPTVGRDTGVVRMRTLKKGPSVIIVELVQCCIGGDGVLLKDTESESESQLGWSRSRHYCSVDLAGAMAIDTAF